MKKWVAFLVLLGVCWSSLGCRQVTPRGADEILCDYMARQDSLPAGVIYRAGAAEGEDGYFSAQMMARMYGEEADIRCFSLVEDYAIYLSSFAEPCEIAVLRCYAKSDCDRIAEMCLARIETLRIALVGTPYRARADAASVVVEGNLVVMRLLP